ncbi:MAG: sigma 54-interacting transcriptional regulator [Clostridiales Family XIII bacterium]|jgi:transcriptional regulator with PAS, ATPase and Fis domain|nr:sigma 54-interacting transcriptional regulator [Clostridiales Family XIII bacterium]
MPQAGTTEIEKLVYELEYYKERALEVMIMGDKIGDGVIMIDGQYNIVQANDTVRRRLTPDIGRHIKDVSAPAYEACLESQALGRSVTKILDMAGMQDGRWMITANVFTGKNGDLRHTILVFRDLTELNKLQLEVGQMEKDRLLAIEELEKLKKQLKPDELVFGSAKMTLLFSLVKQVADTDVTVLIEGETGTGKELIAHQIYENSARRDKPFVKVNCAAIPETLLESEMFGYAKGSFTGALKSDKLGLFESANDGTILLDEIGELPMNLQVKLLRAIQEREVMKIGSTHATKVNVRIIAATNMRLSELVAAGRFRQDLYYRLKVVPIYVPPLRERRSDISLLAGSFLERFNKKHGKQKTISIAALVLLEKYDWPGNVRELENTMERLVVFGNNMVIKEDEISACIYSDEGRNAYTSPNERGSLKEQVHDYERHIIENALMKHGSTRKAAVALGVTQSTIMRKIKLFGISGWR